MENSVLKTRRHALGSLALSLTARRADTIRVEDETLAPSMIYLRSKSPSARLKSVDWKTDLQLLCMPRHETHATCHSRCVDFSTFIYGYSL
jgi:hypothetical protein